MNKKQTVLAAAGGVSAALVLGAGFLAFTSWQSAEEAKHKMDRAKGDLARIYREEVTPNEANVAIVEANRDRIRQWVVDLSRGLFRDGVPLDNSVTRGDFSGRVCRETVEALVADAPLNAAEEPVADETTTFGFDHYLAGNLPQSEEYVPRLVRQLKLVDRIVRLLYAAGIHRLDAVGRETFDMPQSGSGAASASFSGDGAPRGRGRNRGRGGSSAQGSGPSAVKSVAVPPPAFRPDDDVPMACERFGFVFSTRQEGLIAAINAIDAMRPFAMVSGLSFAKTGEDVVKPAEPDPQKEQPAGTPGILEKPAPRTARLVSGPLFETPVRVVLFVDVFSPAAPEAREEERAEEEEDGWEEEE